ncbi:MAG: multicopper oxidase domain-containing protein [Kineosporiaceae bacterium]
MSQRSDEDGRSLGAAGLPFGIDHDGPPPTPETFFTQTPAPATRRPGLVVVALAMALTGALLVAGTWFLTTRTQRAALHSGMTAADAAGMTGTTYWQSVQGGYHPTGRTRTYYLGADELVWDYTPSGKNLVTAKPFDDDAKVFVAPGPDRIGSRYLKCLYHSFTDATFTTRSPRTAADAYLGFTGPVIRAEVGDTITVVFRNRSCRMPVSVHPHGVFYLKASEGAPYADNTSGNDTLDDGVAMGATHTYTWLVPDRAGPGPQDGSSVMWMYHSHTDEVSDTYAGLQGFMAITAQGMAKADGSPKDVDREVFELFAVMDENQSSYLSANIDRLPKGHPRDLEDDEDFVESNLMHSINGYLYGNQPTLVLRKGERVRWYLMSMGTEVDLHTPHWHGNDALVGGMRMDVVSLMPATMVTADMVPDNTGTWLFHCHVNDHLTAGMITRYQVGAA